MAIIYNRLIPYYIEFLCWYVASMSGCFYKVFSYSKSYWTFTSNSADNSMNIYMATVWAVSHHFPEDSDKYAVME